MHTAPAVPSSLIVDVTAPLQPPAQVNPRNRTAVSHMAAEPAAANWNIAPHAETLAQLLEAAGTTAAAATAAHQESGGSPLTARSGRPKGGPPDDEDETGGK